MNVFDMYNEMFFLKNSINFLLMLAGSVAPSEERFVLRVARL